MVPMGGEEEEQDMESIERSYLELLGAEDFLMVKKEERIEVEEGFLFSLPLPYNTSSSSSSSSSSSTSCYPHMLHFGGVGNYEQSCISTPSPPTPSSGKAKVKHSRRGNANSTTKETKETTSKKAKPQGTIKVRKEKLGDKINALQQLVSPFGKTDTATVLHEALGYITFLHDQVQVLSSPYMQSLPSSGHQHEGEGLEGRRELRSRGLCLVPLSCTETMAGDKNGADMWSPAAVGGRGSRSSTSSSSGSKH